MSHGRRAGEEVVIRPAETVDIAPLQAKIEQAIHRLHNTDKYQGNEVPVRDQGTSARLPNVAKPVFSSRFLRNREPHIYEPHTYEELKDTTGSTPHYRMEIPREKAFDFVPPGPRQPDKELTTGTAARGKHVDWVPQSKNITVQELDDDEEDFAAKSFLGPRCPSLSPPKKNYEVEVDTLS